MDCTDARSFLARRGRAVSLADSIRQARPAFRRGGWCLCTPNRNRLFFVGLEYNSDCNQDSDPGGGSIAPCPLAALKLAEPRRGNAPHVPVRVRGPYSPYAQGTGVVIAGFGEKDVYPSLVAFMTDGVLLGHCRLITLTETSISTESTASIIPFAQSEMVYTFMEGVNPDYQQKLEKYFEGQLQGLVRAVSENATELSPQQRKALDKSLSSVIPNLLENLRSAAGAYRTKYHSSPVTMAVSALPKDELAAMAESLVNLTSFKRKISMEHETVGGDIDVAVISKGDGFVWIRRKHYFSADLNPRFLARYVNNTQDRIARRATRDGI